MRNRFIIPKEKFPELRESKKNFFMEIIKDTLLGNIFLLDMIPNIYNYCEAFIDMIRFDWFKGLAIDDLINAKQIESFNLFMREELIRLKADNPKITHEEAWTQATSNYDGYKKMGSIDVDAKKINDIANINDTTKIYNIDQIKKYMGWYCKCYRDKYGRRSKYISEICDHCMFERAADDSYYDFEKKQLMSSSQKNNH